MSRTFAFLQACGVFFVLTTEEGRPQGRPFGAVMEQNDVLYISTGASKKVCAQLRGNPAVQIIALRHGTREWIRLSGTARECTDIAVKRAMLEACPALKTHYASPEDQEYVIFAIDDRQAFLNTNGEWSAIDTHEG